MNDLITNQALSFGIYIICGAIIGVFFDIFRILRKSFKTTDVFTYIQDTIFGILTGIFLILILFVFNNGELRFYIFLALFLGLILYLTTISKYFIKINVKVVTSMKLIVTKTLSIIIYPIRKTYNLIKKLLSKLILKPFRIFTINIRKIKIAKKPKKDKKHNIFLKFKKDFIK